MEETEKQETDRNLDEVWAVLIKEGSVPFLELVVNHASFAQTVENTFSVSFLVRPLRLAGAKSQQGSVLHCPSAVCCAPNRATCTAGRSGARPGHSACEAGHCLSQHLTR